MARVDLEGVTRQVGDDLVLDDVSLEAADGEFVAVIGSSGAGKTTVLRVIAGFDAPTAGVVRFDGRDVTQITTRDRDVGMISQDNTLFPTHRVRSNLLLPFLHRAQSRAEARKRVEAESRAQNISHILDRWPESLSGGEQQLAQIARALVRVPEVLLMDEPLAKLDVAVRRRLRDEIVELQRGYGVTLIYVSNRPGEILSMPDRLIALDRGRVVQTGTPSEVRARPSTLAIAELTGPISRLNVTVEADSEGYWIAADGVRLRAWTPLLGGYVGQPLTLAVRADAVQVGSSGPIKMVSGGLTLLESKSARELRSAAGVLYTYETDIASDRDVFVTLSQWLLFDVHRHLILSFPP